jgi:outer membrane lipoprotein carrier protein
MRKTAVRLAAAGLMLVFVAGVLRAADVTVNEILARMEQAEGKIATVSFDFTQEISYKLTKEKQTNAGEVVFQKPNNLYLKQTNPLEQVIIANGKKVWIYTPAYKQVLSDSWKRWTQSSLVPSSMLNFGQNYSDLKKKYDFSLEGTENGDYVLLLVPRAKEAYAWQLKLWIDQTSMAPGKAVLYGDNVTITTRTLNYKVNPPVDKKLFMFQAPPGVETLSIP